MARKDVNDYFMSVCEDYHNMIETLHEVEDYAQENIISPERLDEIKASIEPIKNNYLRISYIMYLLDKPVNKKKHKWFNKTTRYNTSNDLNKIKQEDEELLNKIKKGLK